VLLDSYWFNTEDEADNDEMAALINRIAADEHPAAGGPVRRSFRKRF